MKIICVNRKYHNIVGGVERMSIALMNEMSRRGHDAHLLSLDAKDAQAFYDLEQNVQWHKVDCGNPDHKATLGTKLKRACIFRKIVKSVKPDVMIGFQDGAFLSTRIYTFGMGVPVIAAERNAPNRFDFLSAGKHKDKLFQMFRLASRITVQCESYPDQYPAYLRKKISVIPNPVQPVNSFTNPKGKDGEKKVLLSVGRLAYQKNYKVLLEAFKILHPACPDWILQIVGNGDDKEKLEKYIDDNGLNECINLVPETRNVEEYYTSAHLFCLPSLWEGFPNALAEAASHGLPLVGFQNCAGVNDLIKDGENGALAAGEADPVTLAAALKKLMADDNLREKMGQNAIESMKPFAPEKVFNQWEELFKGVSGKS